MIFFRTVSLFVIILITSSSCETKMTYEQAIKKSYGKVVDFTWHKQYIQKDTTIFESSLLQAPIKIVAYIDKKLCDPCFTKYLLSANEFMKRFPTDSVKYICIVASRTEDQIKKCMTGFYSESCVVIHDT